MSLAQKLEKLKEDPEAGGELLQDQWSEPTDKRLPTYVSFQLAATSPAPKSSIRISSWLHLIGKIPQKAFWEM